MTNSKTPAWPSRIQTLCHQVQGGSEAARGELWTLLNTSIFMYLQRDQGRLGGLAREDMEDLASQKALDLLGKAEQGVWDPKTRSESEIAGYLAKVARNGAIDFLRKQGRQVTVESPAELEPLVSEEEHPSESPLSSVARREYVDAIKECFEQLQERSKRIWFFRVFLDMSSRDIATHPEVGLKSSHIDVVLQRTRKAMRHCMDQKELNPLEIPTGTFVELWKLVENRLSGERE
ncbi:MAG: RNA polymerase sigma factor [Candidatus Eisenbacteria bacterium]|uniref:RNA polymerase sigma factor n=1 Tax=Eiseniibacteriota bacterium TaxID=2212470 RepID=A0A7Y2E9A4_UNCEI|nr:RNA polymerase sigma factor [Candidatus Eisenbacteria bacterium]